MAPVATSPTAASSSKRSSTSHSTSRKRPRTSYAAPPHPQGLKPTANALLSPSTLRQTSLGAFSALHDDLLLHLLSVLSPRALARLSCVSRVLSAYAAHEALWREALLSEGGAVHSWHGSWRRTYAAQLGGAFLSAPNAPVHVRGLYSDVLHTPWRLAHAPLHLAFSPAPPAAQNTIPRLPCSTTREFFEEEYAGRLPAILTGAARDWPALGWTLDDLAKRCARREVQAEAMRCSAATYRDYARAQEALLSCTAEEEEAKLGLAYDAHATPDESPLYLFDASLPSAIHADWSVPALLSRSASGKEWDHDLFGLLGPVRPDYRWIIAGPKRSGSGWHKDPNATSAWNGVLSGAKYWLFLPPDTPPPGVFVSRDQGEVTAPLSIAEWAEGYLSATREKHGRREEGGDGKLREGVCNAGDVAYVPAGWWHLVVNLEESVAFTQNLISRHELPGVLDFMRRRPEQVSGFKPDPSSSAALASTAGCDDEAAPLELFDDFCAKLRAYDEELLQAALGKIEEPKERGDGKGKKEAWWTRMKEKSGEREGAGFALALDEEELGEVPW